MPGYGQAIYLITDGRVERSIPAGFLTDKAGLMTTYIDRVIDGLRLLYLIIERRNCSVRPFSIDDIVLDYQKTVKDDQLTEAIGIAKDLMITGSEAISIGRDFKKFFRVSDERYPAEGLNDYLTMLINRCRAQGRNSVARSYRSLQLSLVNDIALSEIDSLYIRGYYDMLSSRGISDDTQSFYIRTLRSVLNHAGREGLITVDRRWFEGLNTHIDKSNSRTLAKALDKEKLRAISDIDLSTDKELELARDVFMFCFYMRGMELVDAAHLRRDNVANGYVTYQRRLKGTLQHVPIEPQARAMIEKYRSDDRELLFPILPSSRTETFEAARNAINSRLKAIGRKVDCPNLTFSMSRGSWLMLMSNSSLSEALL